MTQDIAGKGAKAATEHCAPPAANACPSLEQLSEMKEDCALAALGACKPWQCDALASQLVAMPAHAWNKRHFAISDAIYKQVTVADYLAPMLKARFGVATSLDSVDADQRENAETFQNSEPKKEVPWTVAGLRHLYDAFIRLPQAHLNTVVAIVTFDTASVMYGDANVVGKSWADPNLLHGQGFIRILYSDSHLVSGKNAKSDRQEDLSYGFDKLSFAVLHEIAHSVDSGKKYSGEEDYRKITDWKAHPVSDPDQLVQAIFDCLAVPTPPMTDAEIAATKNVGKAMIKDREITRKNLDGAVSDVEFSDQDPETQEVSREILRQKIRTSGLILHILRAFANQDPWNKEDRFDNMKDRHIHEGYTGDNFWYSYPIAARKSEPRINSYQFRDPSEEFAEVYAMFYITKTENSEGGKKLPDKFKTWFIGKGLHTGQDKGSKNPEQPKHEEP